jgi:diguanylate cyclase (GGDEF)-like protein
MTSPALIQVPQAKKSEQPALTERLESVTRIARRLFRVPIALVSLIHDGRLKLQAAQGVPQTMLGTEVPFDLATLASHGPKVVADTMADPKYVDHPWVSGRPHIRFYAGTLILGPDNEIAGVLSVGDRTPHALAEADLLLLRDLAKLVESELRVLALGHAQAALVAESEQLRRRALIDSSTQLWNRHAMFELLDREFHRARRENEGVAVILAEIDNFEAITKEHGPSAGTTVLQEVTNRFRAVVRRSDTVARFGPDEFLAFLGRCDLDNAKTLAERMRQRIRKTPIAFGSTQIAVSMTFGVAAGDENTDWTPDSLVRRADEALAQAVNAGRNCVGARKL